MDWMNWASIPGRTRDCSVVQNVETGCRTHPASCWLPRGKAANVCEFDHLVQSVRMSGDIPLLSLYTFLVWRERTLPLPLALRSCSCKPYVCIIVTRCFVWQCSWTVLSVCLCHKTTLHTKTWVSCVTCVQ